MPYIKEYATEALIQTSIVAELHGSLSQAIELAERVKAFRASMLGAALEQTGGQTGPSPVRSVVDELRDHIYRTNTILSDAMEALAAVERELN